MGREREKKIFVRNSVHTRPRQEHFEKDSKKIQKIKKPPSGNISSQNGMRQAEKGTRKIQSRIPFVLDPVKKILKKIAKNFKNFKKPLFGIISSQNGMRQAEKETKKFQSRIPFTLDPVKKIRKKVAKKFKIIKNLFPALFLAKTG